MSKMRNRIASALLAGTVAATTLLSGLTSLPAQAETERDDALINYRYAVQIYGIGVDELSGGETGGLTLGPAIGGNYTSTSKAAHTATGQTSEAHGGHDHRCIHSDYENGGWDLIIAWNNLDPWVYEQCIDEQCTATVRLNITSDNGSTSSDNTKVFKVQVSEMTGDGVGAFFQEMQNDSSSYAMNVGEAYTGTYDGLTWQNSNLRAALNGYDSSMSGTYQYARTDYTADSNSFLSGFPENLRDAIGAKKVAYATSYSDRSSQAYTYDKLWLFSASELYGDSISSYRGGDYYYSGEGARYARTSAFTTAWNVTKEEGKAYNAKSNSQYWWLRSRNATTDGGGARSTVAGPFLNRSWVMNSQSSYGVAPGFVLRRDTSDIKVTVVFQQARGGADAPDEVDVQLQRKDGNDYVDEGSATTITKDTNDQYTHTFAAADGFDWQVIAAEDVEGYNSPTISGDAQSGYTITYTQNTTAVEARITFDLGSADQPEEITLALLDDEGNVVDTQVVNADNDWTYSWTDLIEGTYTVAIQDIPDGYETSMEFKDGAYVITYRRIPDAPADEDNAGTGHARACHHRYEWEVYRKATALEDGIMRYRCRYCGKVEYEVPTAAYYAFNKETQESIRDAAANATVRVSTPIFISFHEMVRDALQERPDVTLVVEYRYDGDLYEMTIPAGSGDTLGQLFGESQYAGFLYLGGVFNTVAK